MLILYVRGTAFIRQFQRFQGHDTFCW